jgi:hypothetical protein
LPIIPALISVQLIELLWVFLNLAKIFAAAILGHIVLGLSVVGFLAHRAISGRQHAELAAQLESL